jgi:hypothetical protein
VTTLDLSGSAGVVRVGVEEVCVGGRGARVRISEGDPREDVFDDDDGEGGRGAQGGSRTHRRVPL